MISGSKKSGYKVIYKYTVVAQSYGYMLVFLLVFVFSKKAINHIIESIKKQKQFITDAGHEIKTPLAIISANADVLELTGGENEWITSIRNQRIRLDKHKMLRQRFQGKLIIDNFRKTAINNIYFDTPDHLLIRNSLEKPIYKEKLRLRSYGTPSDDDMVYIELKKKYMLNSILTDTFSIYTF